MNPSDHSAKEIPTVELEEIVRTGRCPDTYAIILAQAELDARKGGGDKRNVVIRYWQADDTTVVCATDINNIILEHSTAACIGTRLARPSQWTRLTPTEYEAAKPPATAGIVGEPKPVEVAEPWINLPPRHEGSVITQALDQLQCKHDALEARVRGLLDWKKRDDELMQYSLTHTPEELLVEIKRRGFEGGFLHLQGVPR